MATTVAIAIVNITVTRTRFCSSGFALGIGRTASRPPTVPHAATVTYVFLYQAWAGSTGFRGVSR